MRRSEHGFLTTHTGSLPRPEDLQRAMFAKLEGEPHDAAQLEVLVREAVSDAVRRQAEAGIDIVSDGEMSREGMQYLREHAAGFDGESKPFMARDVLEHPDAAARLGAIEGVQHMKTPACTGAIKYRDTAWLQTDITNLTDALEGVDADEAFLTVTSPGTVAQLIENQHYESREAYLSALADAIKIQCDAIAEAGFLVQVDACDLPMEFHVDYRDLSRSQAHQLLEANVGAINRALADIPRDRIRLHVCWGNYPGPHHHDVPVAEIMDLILAVKAGAISFPAANPRHEHEWRAWETADLPDDVILIPGVIDTVSTFIEHPRVVADRISRFARIVGAENVIASTDCGFGTFVGFSAVAPSVAYAKLAALAQGAALASDELFAAGRA
jgi:5-methyltetrahydropteroyltriglutamate--homocysteine methyltransferase